MVDTTKGQFTILVVDSGGGAKGDADLIAVKEPSVPGVIGDSRNALMGVGKIAAYPQKRLVEYLGCDMLQKFRTAGKTAWADPRGGVSICTIQKSSELTRGYHPDR